MSQRDKQGKLTQFPTPEERERIVRRREELIREYGAAEVQRMLLADADLWDDLVPEDPPLSVSAPPARKRDGKRPRVITREVLELVKKRLKGDE
jgi:hypothetical protein